MEPSGETSSQFFDSPSSVIRFTSCKVALSYVMVLPDVTIPDTDDVGKESQPDKDKKKANNT